jgi:hypothetical protein
LQLILRAALAEIARLQLLIASCSAIGLAAGPSGSTTRSCSKGSRIWSNRWLYRLRFLGHRIEPYAALARG